MMPFAIHAPKPWRPWATLALATLLAGQAAVAAPHGHPGPDADAAHHQPDATPLPATPLVLDEWQPLVAQYRVTMQAKGQPARTETWTLWRDAQRIALIKATTEEVWQRDPSGIRLQRLYHNDHKLVDYTAGELRTMMIDARWLPLGTLIDEALLPQLRRSGPATTPRYSGQLQGEQIDLQWDAARRLPIRLSRRTAKGSVHFQRLAVHTQAPMRWPVPTPDRSDYDRLDAADFGDMEGDPFVRKVLAQDVRIGWRVDHDH